MSWLSRIVILGVLLFALVGRVTIRFAEASEGEAAQLLERAKARYAAGDFAAARTLLTQALGKEPQPKMLGQIHYHLGLAHAADSRIEQAREAFRAALSTDPSLRIDPYRYKPALVETFEQARRSLVADLEVDTTSKREDLAVFVDGKQVGAPPLKFSVVAGNHRIELRDPSGKVLGSRQVAVAGGAKLRVEITPAPPPVPAFVAAKPPRKEGAGGRVQATKPARPTDSRRRGRLRWTWLAAAATTAAAALAIGFGAAAIDGRDEGCSLLADKSLPCDHRSTVAEPDEQRYLDLRDTVATRRTISNIAWVTMGVGVVATATLFWLERRAGPANGAVAAPLLHPNGGGLTVRLGF